MVSFPAMSNCHFRVEIKDRKITFFNIGRASTSKSLIHYSTVTEALFFKCLLYFTALVISNLVFLFVCLSCNHSNIFLHGNGIQMPPK